jgi:glutathione S-transferase
MKNLSQGKPVLFYEEGACSLGALIALVWIDRPFYTCRLGDGDNENANFLELNALGEVPLLFTDGKVITENTAVLPYIAEIDLTRGFSFMEGTPERSQLNRALGFLASDFHKSFAGALHPEAFHKNKKIQKEIKATVVKGRLKEGVDHVEKHMLSESFIFDRPTIVDAYLFAMTRWVAKLYDLEKDFPKLKRFQMAMERDPEVRLAVQIEEGKMKAAGCYLGNLDFKAFTKQALELKKKMKAKKNEGDRPGLNISPLVILSAKDRKQGSK